MAYLSSGTPDPVVVTVLDAAGEPLTTHQASVEWRQVDDGDPCPGPAPVADPVVVPAP